MTDNLSREQKIALLELLEERNKRISYNLASTFYTDAGPNARTNYPKHMEFFEAGAKYKERILVGANRVGKTYAGGMEVMYHMTGLYPDWWKGKRFTKNIKVWTISPTHDLAKQVQQQILCGDISDVGSGLIPKDLIVKYTSKPGITNAMQEVWVRHVPTGKISQVTFMSTVQGREAFQGTAIDVVWGDEETSEDVWSEASTRTMTTKGILIKTFTPLNGLTNLVLKFLPGGKLPPNHVVPDRPGCWVTQITWDDAPHLSQEERDILWASYPDHMKEARSKGIPMVGAGKIYTTSEDQFVVRPFKIPVWWPKVYAIDPAYKDTAVVFAAIDPENDIVYIYDEYYGKNQQPEVNAAAIHRRGKWLPGVADPASQKGSVNDGKKLLSLYRDELGLNLTTAQNGIQSGIFEVSSRLNTGRLKVLETCQHWLAEYRVYRYGDDGKPAKNQADHFMDSTKYLCLSGIDRAELPPDEDDDGFNSKSYWKSLSRDNLTGY